MQQNLLLRRTKSSKWSVLPEMEPREDPLLSEICEEPFFSGLMVRVAAIDDGRVVILDAGLIEAAAAADRV